MTTATIQLSKKLYNRATRASKSFNQPVESLLKQVLKHYLPEYIEDLKDERKADKILERVRKGGRTYSMEEVERECGLED